MNFYNSLPSQLKNFLVALGLFVHFTLAILTNFRQNTVFVVQMPARPVFYAHTTATSTPSPIFSKNIASTSTSNIKLTKTLADTIPTQKQTSTQITTTNATLDTASVMPSAQTISDENAQARAALVNILCTTGAGGAFEPISGSGVFVDSRGVILTNAHVAQYFLLKDFPYANNVQCVIRTGSPATAMYTAQLLYLPPEWVSKNAGEVITEHPLGNGENDYAFLYVTGTVGPDITLPASFPALPMSTEAPTVNAPVLLAAYPAQLLDGETIQENLYSSSAASTVQQVYSYDGTHVDIISLGGSVVSQQGSSGGAVIGLGSKQMLGIIATESTGTTTSDRILNALSFGYINRSLADAGQGGVVQLLTGDLLAKVQDFAENSYPTESNELIQAIEGK